MICKWRAFQRSCGNNALRSRSTSTTLRARDRPHRPAEPMDVRVDGKCRLAECLGDDHARRLVTDAGQLLERGELAGDLTTVLGDQ